jgi:hypothetical protein
MKKRQIKQAKKNQPKSLQYRSDDNEVLEYRSLAIRAEGDGPPSTFNEQTRSVEVVCGSEDPVEVFDNTRWEVVREVLLMSGCVLPENRQIIFLDCHQRFGVGDVLGSCRDLNIQAPHLIGRTYFSTVEKSEDAMIKVKERHLTDVSLGYKVESSVFIEDGSELEIDGRMFAGPLKVATRWRPRELSLCPVGADEQAKTRSATNNNKKQEGKGKTMELDKEIRAFLESRGLSKGATDPEARAFLATLDIPQKRAAAAPPAVLPAAAKAPEKTEDEIRADGARAEQDRMLEIRAMCDQFEMGPEADALTKDNTPIEQARKIINDKYIAAKQALNTPPARHDIEMGLTESDKFRAAAEDSLAMRHTDARVIENPAAGAEDLMGFSLIEMARQCLRIAGQPAGGNIMQMVGRAMTTSDFPKILANAANKSLAFGWESASETYGNWCDDGGSVSDFKTHTDVRSSESEDLDEIGESEEYKYGNLTEAQEQYSIATYGKLLMLSRRTIINDDVNALTGIPAKHGEACARKIGDVAYAVLTANAAMGDGTALFASGHANLAASAKTAPAVASLALGIKEMKLQKDIKAKRRLNIRPVFAIMPVTLEGAAEQFFNTLQIGGAANQPNLINPYAGKYFNRIYEPRLDDDSITVWYLAGPKGKTVKIFYLNGIKTPYLETRNGFNVDGVEYKVRIDVGAKAMDWKGLWKNPGA